MAGSILCNLHVLRLLVGFFSFLCVNAMSFVQESNKHTSISLSKKIVAKQSIIMCAMFASVGMTGNVLCRCPRCFCLCANTDVQERNRQEQKFQTTKAAEKFKLIFFFSSYRIRQYSHVSFINAKVGIRAENLDRRESRKPSLEAFHSLEQ